MAEVRKVQVPWMGRMVNGMDVPVDESNEKWSEVKLVDGTIIRVKQTVASVLRLENEWDQEGNPIYVVKSAPAIAIIHVDETLRKGAIKN